MKYNDYYNICNFAQKFYEDYPILLPTNNIITIWRAQIKRHNVISDEFNALFYYEYIMYLIGICSKCFKHKKN